MVDVGRAEVKLQLVASPRNQFFWTTTVWLSRLRRVTPAAPLKLNRRQLGISIRRWIFPVAAALPVT